MSQYVEEKYDQGGLKMGFALKQKLFSQQSTLQKVEVVETTHHGKMLFNDGCAMVSERDEAIYHEMMAHVPLFTHPAPRRILIVGGGDGGTAREVLRHPGVESVVMVEIDQVVVDACKEFIPQTASALKDPRLHLLIEDGVKFMATSRDLFDVILIDSTDPVGPAEPLFGVEFYQNVKARLHHGGVVVAQGETPFYAPEAQVSLMKVVGQCFSIVQPYNFTNMTYPGGLWSFIWASNGLSPLRDFNPERVLKSNLFEFAYYNEEVHRAAFALPSFMKRSLKSFIKGHL